MLASASLDSDQFTQLLKILLLAFALDVALGDPKWLYQRIPHPVVIMGRLIQRLDASLNVPGRPDAFTRGLLVVLALTAAMAVFGAGLSWLLSLLSWGWVLEAILVSTLLAFRGLYDHVKAVGLALQDSLPKGREAVSRIVGRDVTQLDTAGVCRAALESLAENFSDGVVAPIFWYLFLGLPGLLAYKTLNTLDSMIGHRSPRYERFGKAAARLDDAANLAPARLAAALIAAAAILLPGASGRAAWQAAWRDAGRHRSPNAGWQEAALAGALGLALAGPRRYGQETVDDAWMGDGRADVTEDDLARGLDLYVVAGSLSAVLLLALFSLAALAGSSGLMP